MTSVILGAIERRKRTNLQGFQVYLASLRWHNPDVPMVLFSRSQDDPDLDVLSQRYAVTTIDALAFDRTHQIPAVEIEIARFLQYRAWLADHPTDQVILTDVLDVLFQQDPVAQLPSEGMTVYQERQIIGHCPYNRKWVREAWPASFTRFLDQIVVCCGVIAGSGETILTYLDWYAAEYASRHGVRRGFDSAVLTGYVYDGHGVGVTAYLNPECMHLGYAAAGSVTYGGVVRCEDLAPAIVHQYNRHPEVAEGLYTRWT